jgi:hypothetical protein
VTKTSVLAPGLHVYANNIQQRVGTEEFCERALATIPPGVLYRKAGVVGRILDGDFSPITASQARLIVDTYAEIEVHSIRQKAEAVQFLPCSTELGQALIDHVGALPTPYQADNVRILRACAPHPVLISTGRILGPGWHPWWGILVTWDGILGEPESPIGLVQDFGLDPISQANAIALMLTVLARPALQGNVPLFVVTAPVAGAGKTKLVDEVVGSITLGHAVPSMVWPGDPEEIRKTLTAAMMSGSQLLNIDNVPRVLDSDSLASFLTTSSWRDRILGKSQSVEIPNTITLVATGNQVQASGELARRSVRIEIKPACDNPETRSGPGTSPWRHQRLRAAALAARPGVLCWLIDLVNRWVDAGRPVSGISLGSFEAWVSTVVDPLKLAGFAVLDDVHEAAATIDVERRDLVAVCDEWWRLHGAEAIYPKDVLAIADAVEAWQPLIASRNNERGQTMILGQKLARLVGRVVGPYTVVLENRRNGRAYRLVSAL